MLADDSKPGQLSNYNLSTAADRNRDASHPGKTNPVEAINVQIQSNKERKGPIKFG